MSVPDFLGEPGRVGYAEKTSRRGDELKIGDWLDALNQSGACKIHAIGVNSDTGARYVGFSEWWLPIQAGTFNSDWRMVRDDVQYDVVDPDTVFDLQLRKTA